MSIRRPILWSLLAPLASSLGCSPPPSGSDLEPFRDQWREEFVGAFPWDNADAPIAQLTVGGTLYNDNFANRGDVIVIYEDQDPANPTIKIELRRFTMASSEEDAQVDFDKLQLWAYDTSVTSPKQPGNMDPAASCVTGSWKNGCGIRLWYDGLIQKRSTGADIRVTIPRAWKRDLLVATQDNGADDTYQDRGNVCIENVPGSAPDVELQNGLAFVIFDENVTPTPLCSAADIMACETWNPQPDDDMMPNHWALDCPCLKNGEVGEIDVTGRAGAANITVDVPPDLWATFRLENKAMASAAMNCTANVVGMTTFELDAGTTDRDWVIAGVANKPGPDAVAGGFSIRVSADDCAPVRFTENPDDWIGADQNPEMQMVEQRGNLEACAGCLRGKTCKDLLPSDI